MTSIVDWAASRARMVIAFIALSLIAGGGAYFALPKEGEPDIEIPALFVSVPFPGISAADAETLLVQPMEIELSDIDGLKSMDSTAAEGYAGVALEFEFGWDRGQTIADVREAMGSAEAEFPEGFERYSINEINFSEFPIIIVNLTGRVPERTMARVAKQLQDDLESLDAVLEVGLAGGRDEMVEVLVDPLRLEAYNITAAELIRIVRNNNQLIAAGSVETDSGRFSVKVPSSFSEPRDIYALPIIVDGDSVVTLSDLTRINLTFEDRQGTARFNGENTVALQVVKRKGVNLIDTAALVREKVAESSQKWPEGLRAVVHIGTSNDQSRIVNSMVRQLEGSVLTAVALVMIVVLASLGTRAALLVGFAVPTSFLLCFALLALLGVSISNIVMFGLILAVGMLVDGAVVVVEYADKRIKEGIGPMHAYVLAAKRMFWPVVSSTATTLCAFLPMLFWPGLPGQFMRMLPITLIFVLSASLVVALVYLPVMGGVSGRLSRLFDSASEALRRRLPWLLRALLVPLALYVIFIGALQTINPGYLFGGVPLFGGVFGFLPGMILFLIGAFAGSITLSAARIETRQRRIRAGRPLSPFGWFIKLIVGNPIMPIVSIASVVFMVVSVFIYYGQNNNGVEFFVESEPEQAIVYVRARGNLSLEQKDALVREAEAIVLAHPGIATAFAFAGAGGLDTNTSGGQGPRDTIGQIQLETLPWEERPDQSEPWFSLPFVGTVRRSVKADAFDGNTVLEELEQQLGGVAGAKVEILAAERGPADSKPVHLRLKGDNWDTLLAATTLARAQFDATPGLIQVQDTLPQPGIDWEIDVDVERAGRYGADVATVGAMVQLVTRGVLLDTIRVDSSDEEIEIRARLPEDYRVLSTLDSLRMRTAEGLVPLSNFIIRRPAPRLDQINRNEQTRSFDLRAGVAGGLVVLTPADGTTEPVIMREEEWESIKDAPPPELAGAQMTPLNAAERIATLTEWLNTNPFGPGVTWEWTGDQEEQAESQAFLVQAFAGAMGLMFVILLAQFNSFYNSLLVLLAVVLSTTGVLVGMLVMDQPFSIIMTGVGIVALAGIVVNNNIVLIDTYQEYSQYMPRIEAIVRTAQSRLRPVLLTSITTIAGLTPMMFGVSLDFIYGGYSINSPTSLWWKQLATAVVFGLGIATALTLIFTPSMLAIRVWFNTYTGWLVRLFGVLSLGRGSRVARDWQLERTARRIKAPELVWVDPKPPAAQPGQS
ncbi:MAG: efflux RND transporter permease subunit [Rhodobacteraceae bacterium]|nr:efflux RND transporter permease subunit [Paracoccaceae bacterium]